MTVLELARLVFPAASNDELEYIVWNRTGYPAFWPRRFKSGATALRWQLGAYKRAVEALKPGEHLCEFCNRKANLYTEGNRLLCKRCEQVMEVEP